MAKRNHVVGALGICAAAAFLAATSSGQQTAAGMAPAQPIAPSPAVAAQPGAPAYAPASTPGATAPPRGSLPQPPPNIWYSNSTDPRNAYGQPNIWYSNSTDPAITYGQPNIWYSNSTDPRTSHDEGIVSWYSNSADPDPNRAATAGSFAEEPPPVWISWSSTYVPATVSTEIGPASPPPGNFVSPEAVTGPPVANGFLTPQTPLLGGNGTTATGAFTATQPAVAPPGETTTEGTPQGSAGATTGVATATGTATAPAATGTAPAATATGTAPAATATGTAPAATATGTAPAPTATAPAATATGTAPAPTATAPAATATAPASAAAPVAVPNAGAPPGPGATPETGAVSPAEGHQQIPGENTAAHGEAVPEPEQAMPGPPPVYAAPEDRAADHAAAQAANAANHPTNGNAPPASPAPAKVGSNLTTVILKIAFVALLGLSLCVAATGVIMAIAFGLKSGRTQR